MGRLQHNPSFSFSLCLSGQRASWLAAAGRLWAQEGRAKGTRLNQSRREPPSLLL